EGLQTFVERTLENRLLVIAVLGQTLDLHALDGQRAFVLVDAAAIEHAHFDDRALRARRNPERGIAYVGSLLAEDGAEQLLFRRDRALALRRHLTDEDVARLHFGADIDDAGFVEVLECLFTDVRDIAGDLFLTELGIAGHDLE